MPVEAKSRKANEFKAQANAIRAELLDESKQLTKDEVQQKQDAIQALELRATAIAGFTPEEEIERQGGDELVRAASPEADAEPEVVQYDDLVKDVRKAFGGPNNYLLALAKRGSPDARPWNAKQQATHRKIAAFQKRTIIGDANDASGGEFLLPLQQVASIFTAEIEQPGLLERARQYPVSGRTLRIPLLDQYDAANTRPMAGIAAVTIVGEGGEKPVKEPQFIQRLLTVYKWAAYTEFGDEILADDMTGDAAPTVTRAVGGQVVNEINGYVTVDGSGTSQPLGALHANNAALYTVNRDTSMQIKPADIFEMDARHVEGPGSFWLAHVSTKPQLYAMTLNAGSMVTWISDLRSRPIPMLMGKPVIFTHLTSLLGVAGDLSLINPAFYAVAMRQALTVESSIHYKFRNDITAYRFFARAGGIPIPTGTYSYKSSGSAKTYEVSPFVRLGDDATS